MCAHNCGVGSHYLSIKIVAVVTAGCTWCICIATFSQISNTLVISISALPSSAGSGWYRKCGCCTPCPGFGWYRNCGCCTPCPFMSMFRVLTLCIRVASAHIHPPAHTSITQVTRHIVILRKVFSLMNVPLMYTCSANNWRPTSHVLMWSNKIRNRTACYGQHLPKMCTLWCEKEIHSFKKCPAI